MTGRWEGRPLRGIRREEGATLVELLVAFGVFAILLAIITAATLSMFQSSRKQASEGTNLDTSRKFVEWLDKQVRYANAITTPGTGASGDTYVEWRSGNVGDQQQQTCTQLRFDPSAKQFQYRSWQPKLGLAGQVNGSPTSFVTLATGISPVSGTSIFSIVPFTWASPTPSPPSTTKEQLTVVFTTTTGQPAQSQTSQVTLTATNSTSASAPTGAQAVCNEVLTGGTRP